MDNNLAFDIDDQNSGLLPPLAQTDLFGHQDIEQQLLKDIQAGRLPHAIILSGAQGIGKATLAFRLARYLLSGAGEDSGGLFGDAPDTSKGLYVSPDNPVTHRIAAGGHMDLLVIAPPEEDDKKKTATRNIPVETVRKIMPFLSKTAGEGGWRVVVVDGVEFMNRSGQNAILKILEEPPEKTVLILTTAEPGKLLPTIHSRCRMVPMKPLENEDVQRLLQREIPDITQTDMQKILHIAEGRIGHALTLYECGGVDLYADILALFADMPENERHSLADKLGGKQKQYHVFMEILIWFLARMAKDSLCGVTDETGVMARHSPKTWFAMWENVKQCYTRGEYANLDRRLTGLQIFDILKGKKG